MAPPPGMRRLGWGMFVAPRAAREELRSGVVDVGALTMLAPESDWRTGLQLVNAGPSPVLVSHQRDDLLADPPRGMRIPPDQTPVAVPPAGALWGRATFTPNALRCGFSHYPTHSQIVEIVAAQLVGSDQTITVSAWVLAPAGAPYWWGVAGRNAALSGAYQPASYTRRIGTGTWELLSATITGTSYFLTPPADGYRPGLALQSDWPWTGVSGDPAYNANPNGWNYGPVYVDYLTVELSNGSQLITDPGFDAADVANLVSSSSSTNGPANREFDNTRSGTDTRPLRWTCYLDVVGGATDTDALPPTGSSVSAGSVSIPAAGTTHTREVWSEPLRATAGQTWSYAVAWTNPAGLSHAIMAVGAYNAAGTWISDVFFVDDVTVGARSASGSFVTPANTASLRWRLHNYQNAAGTITVQHARLLLTNPAAASADAVIAGRDGWRGGAIVTTAETIIREY